MRRRGSGGSWLWIALASGALADPVWAQSPLVNGETHAGVIGSPGETDTWTFSAPAGAAIVVRMGEVGGDSELAPWLRIYEPSGSLLDSASAPHATEVEVTAPFNGTYTVVAASNDSGNDGMGDYVVTLALLPGSPIVSAGDQGGAMTSGLNHAGALHVGDLDQWTVTAAAGAAIVIRIGEVGGDSELVPWLRLYGPGGALLALSSDPQAAEVAAIASLAGTYTVVVATADDGDDASGDYLVTLALAPGSPQLSTGDQGGALINGLNHAGEIHVGDLDQWTFTAPAGAGVRIRIAEVGGDSELNPWLRLYGPGGTHVDSSQSAFATEVSTTAFNAGTYTLVVATADLGYDATGDYLVTLALVPGLPQLSAGDQGGALINGLNHEGELHAGDLDQWTFAAAAGAAIRVRIGEVGGDSALRPRLLLYGPGGAILGSAFDSLVAEVAVTAPSAGTYTVVVSAVDVTVGAIGDYLVTLALVPGSPQISMGDQGGGMSNGVDYAGDIHVGDLDQWTFSAASGSTLQVLVEELGGDSPLFPSLRLYGPTGVLVGSSSSHELVQVDATAPATGLYTVVVSTVGSGVAATGDYRIRVTGASALTDLRLTQAASSGSVDPGDAVTFTLTVANLGPDPALDVRVADALPAALEVLSCTATGGATCAVSGNTRTVTYASLAAGASQTVTIGTTVNAPLGSVVVNTATVTSSGVDAVSGNNRATAAVVVGTDTDEDGLLDEWETRLGLDPGSAAGDHGRDGDPDGDGLSNWEEQSAGSHPRGFFHALLAEGAANSFFDVRLALLNVGTASGRLLIRYLQPGGAVVSQYEALASNRRLTLVPPAGLTSADFSSVVEADQPIVLDRTMTWGGGYGSHAETGVAGAATTWYLAEGSTSSVFSLFYLIQNPNAAATTLTVRYLLPAGDAPLERTYVLPGFSRTTIPVDDQGGVLASTDVSAVLTAPLPIVVERAMYRSTPTQPFAAGHNSAGVTAPAFNWFLAEGATGPFFDCFILLANPNDQPATATIDYLLSDGRTFTKAYTVPANGRFTVWVDNEEIGGAGIRPLANVAVSSTVTATLPIIVERTMWWPSPETAVDYWTEAHNSPGATATATAWALAEGEVGGTQSAETYILIANTSTTAGSARVTLYFEDGSSVNRTFALLPRSRRNVNVSVDFPTAAGRRFGSLIESLGTPAAEIVVERAMYTSPGGVIWTAGTNALASRRR